MDVSCVMPVYNMHPAAGWLVDEGLKSFMDQDFGGKKELIIINDAPGQILECDCENVIVVNVPKRFRTLGEKLNAAFGLTTGDFLFRWDADDINMPWRISYSLRKLAENACDQWAAAAYWFGSHDRLEFVPRRALSACVFTREAYDKSGGFTHMNTRQDANFDDKVQKAGYTLVCEPTGPRDCFYFYRWYTGHVHLSGLREGGYEKIGEYPITPGNFTLRPRFRNPYYAIIKKKIAEMEYEARAKNRHRA